MQTLNICSVIMYPFALISFIPFIEIRLHMRKEKFEKLPSVKLTMPAHISASQPTASADLCSQQSKKQSSFFRF